MTRRMHYITIAILVFAVVCASIATAIVSPTDDVKNPKMKEIWDAIQDLQNQILNIQLIPGPQGPQGPPGPQGETGPEGPQGPAGQCNFVMVEGDAMNNEEVALPNGFTSDQCRIILQPTYIDFHSIVMRPPGTEPPIPYDLKIDAVPNSNGWHIEALLRLYPQTSGSFSFENKPIDVKYLVICQS